MIEKMLYEVNPPPNIIAQMITPEALIEAVKIVNPEDDTTIQSKCEGFLIVDELSNFLNKKTYDAGIGHILIPLYDCKDHFEYRTKTKGKVRLENACLGILAASTPDWIKAAIPEDSIGGGLTSRVIFVYAKGVMDPVPFPKFGDREREMEESLIKRLTAMAAYGGPMKLSPEADKMHHEAYCHWYFDSKLYDDKYTAGYASRRFTHLLKLSMIFSAVEGDSFVVSGDHYAGAAETLASSEGALQSVIRAITTTEKGSIADSVWEVISRKRRISRAEVLSSFSHRMNAEELTKVIETLQVSGRIVVMTDGNKIIYEARD